MHWKSKARDWVDADPKRVSWRLLEGLDWVLGQIEDAGAGQIRYVRLRRQPTGKAAERAQARYLAWDSLMDCNEATSANIAGEISSAAEHLCQTERCGESFEAQVEYDLGDTAKQKSISFSLGDGPNEDDSTNEDEDEEEGDLAKLTAKGMATLLRTEPALLLMLQQQQHNRDTAALSQVAVNAANERADKAIAQLVQLAKDLVAQANTKNDKFEQTVASVISMIAPITTGSAEIAKIGMQAISATLAQSRENEEAKAEAEFKAKRLETLAGSLGGLKDLGLTILHYISKGSVPMPTPGQPANGTTPGGGPPSSETQDSKPEQIRKLGVQLRAALDDIMLARIKEVDSEIADWLSGVHEGSTAAEVTAALQSINDKLRGNQELLNRLAILLGAGPQARMIVELLRMVDG